VSQWRLAPLLFCFAEMDNTCAVFMYKIGYGLVDYIKNTLYLTNTKTSDLIFAEKACDN
jgi:hypothetical protein